MKIELKAFIVLVLTLICISFWCKTSLATTLTVGYGQDVPVSSWQSEGLECSVIQVEVSESVNSWLYGSVVLDVMEGKANPMTIDGKYFSGTYDGLAVSTRLGLRGNLRGNLRYDLFGGFGVLPKHMPEIGNSGIVGHFGVGVKYVTTNWELGYKITHMSDPLQSGDKGWNIQFITLGWRL